MLTVMATISILFFDSQIMKLWNLRSVEVIHVLVGALGSVSKRIGQYLGQIRIDIRIELLQKTDLLGTAKMLRKLLQTLDENHIYKRLLAIGNGLLF